MVEQWLDKVLDGVSAFMLAVRRDDVTDLNQQARTALQAEGAVGPDTLVADGRTFGVGDWVMTLTNDYRLGVLNGERGAIVAIDPRRHAVHVAFDDNTTKTIPAAYLDGWPRPRLRNDHSQGPGTDLRLRLRPRRRAPLPRAGYSALTRGRYENHLYTADAEPDPEAHTHDEPEDGYSTVLRSLDRSRQQEPQSNRRWNTPSKHSEVRSASTTTSTPDSSCDRLGERDGRARIGRSVLVLVERNSTA